jgi:hypothetical protein
VHINVKQNEEIGSACYSQFLVLFSSLTHFFLLMHYKVMMTYGYSSIFLDTYFGKETLGHHKQCPTVYRNSREVEVKASRFDLIFRLVPTIPKSCLPDVTFPIHSF